MQPHVHVHVADEGDANEFAMLELASGHFKSKCSTAAGLRFQLTHNNTLSGMSVLAGAFWGCAWIVRLHESSAQTPCHDFARTTSVIAWLEAWL